MIGAPSPVQEYGSRSPKALFRAPLLDAMYRIELKCIESSPNGIEYWSYHGYYVGRNLYEVVLIYITMKQVAMRRHLLFRVIVRLKRRAPWLQNKVSVQTAK